MGQLKSLAMTAGQIASYMPGALPLAGELRERLLEECDYTREADAQRRLGELLAEVPGARVLRAPVAARDL